MHFADVDAAAAVRANGGTLTQEPIDIPSVGRVAVAPDSIRGSFSLMQRATTD